MKASFENVEKKYPTFSDNAALREKTNGVLEKARGGIKGGK